MAPILIEPLSEKAYELLWQLEALHILRVVTAEPAPVRKPSIASLVGTLSDESAEQMRAETIRMRNEWDRNA